MTLKAIQIFQLFLTLYTIIHFAEVIFDENAEDDLPDSLRSDYRAVRSRISSLVKSIAQYRDENIATFIAACED